MGSAGTTLIFLVRRKISYANPIRTVVRPCCRAITLTVRGARWREVNNKVQKKGLESSASTPAQQASWQAKAGNFLLLLPIIIIIITVLLLAPIYILRIIN